MKKITLLLLLLMTFLYSSFTFGQYLSEGFESGTAFPDDWVLTQTNITESWEITTEAANSGSNSATVSYSLDAQDETLTSPSINLSSATNPRLMFSWNMSYYWSVDPNNNYDFIVSVDDGTNTTQVFSEADAGVFTNFVWDEKTIDLSAYAGQSDVKIIFNYSGADGASLNIDDILIEEAPSCLPVTNLTASPISPTEVEISWTAGGSETAWEYVFQPLDTGEPTASGTVTTSNPLSLSGLSLAPNTGYEIYLRANCGGDYSSWVQFAFLTSVNCVSNTDAFVHDFQAVILGSVLDASCWSLSNGGDTNTWSLTQDDLGNIFWNLLYSSSAHDDYLYSPTISVVDGVTDGFNFKGWNPNTTWPEVIDVLVVDAADNSVLGTLVTDLNLPEPDATTGGYTVFTYDLSAYEGQDVKIAFHSTTTDQNAARIDDFTIDAFATLGTATNILEGFTLYPTIVKEELNFRSQNKVAAITIFNLLGQKVFSGAPNANNSSVNLSNLRPGMYLVKVKSGNSIGSYKIIKE
jgi:hypothetical protein